MTMMIMKMMLTITLFVLSALVPVGESSTHVNYTGRGKNSNKREFSLS